MIVKQSKNWAVGWTTNLVEKYIKVSDEIKRKRIKQMAKSQITRCLNLFVVNPTVVRYTWDMGSQKVNLKAFKKKLEKEVKR